MSAAVAEGIAIAFSKDGFRKRPKPWRLEQLLEDAPDYHEAEDDGPAPRRLK